MKIPFYFFRKFGADYEQISYFCNIRTLVLNICSCTSSKNEHIFGNISSTMKNTATDRAEIVSNNLARAAPPDFGSRSNGGKLSPVAMIDNKQGRKSTPRCSRAQKDTKPLLPDYKAGLSSCQGTQRKRSYTAVFLYAKQGGLCRQFYNIFH